MNFEKRQERMKETQMKPQVFLFAAMRGETSMTRMIAIINSNIIQTQKGEIIRCRKRKVDSEKHKLEEVVAKNSMRGLI